MYRPFFTKQFQRDIKRLQGSGIRDMDKLKRIVETLVDEALLDKGYLDHPLKGYFKDRRECHLGPDWLLVYKVNKEDKTIIFERTGSRADIFG
jgi:mRNA interferase YafQ